MELPTDNPEYEEFKKDKVGPSRSVCSEVILLSAMWCFDGVLYFTTGYRTFNPQQKLLSLETWKMQRKHSIKNIGLASKERNKLKQVQEKQYSWKEWKGA